jgi:serine/threonine protein phosphatase PrpC
MMPIRDIGELAPGSVLYHSAFGFARVSSVGPDGVSLAWDGTGENLPVRVPAAVVPRVYALCRPDGFFFRSVHDRAALQLMLQEHPMDAVALLLADLHGMQRQQDLREWLVGRGLFSADAFAHWFEVVRALAAEDGRFTVDNGGLALRIDHPEQGPRARLDNPLLAPGRRLDLALEHRDDLDDDAYVGQVVLAWQAGGSQVKDLALAALRDHPPDRLIQGLLAHGPEAIDAIIHGIRRGGWDPDRVSLALHTELVALVLRGLDDDGPLDNEGRLAATLARWPTPGIVEALSDVAGTASGRRLLRATFSALPPRRAEATALDLLALALDTGDEPTAQWIAGEALGLGSVTPVSMADRLAASRPELAGFFREAFRPDLHDATPDRTAADTVEIDLSDLSDEPIALAELPARSGSSLLGLGIAMARALSLHHAEGTIVNPTASRVRVMPNETFEVEPGPEDRTGPHPPMEPPSFAADVYAAAVLLLEAILGRPWPRDLPPTRAVPFLRMVVPLLDPAALAPLDAALHPDAEQRASDGGAWLALWQAAARSAESRGWASRDANARLQIGYDTHVGHMKTLLTQTNQDCLAVATKGPLSLVAVCDGISTANAGTGDVASSIASHVIANLWEQAQPRLGTAGPAEIRDFLDRALRTANTAVCEAAVRFAGGSLEGRVPMGTTCTVAVLSGSWVSLAWLGDSRAYLVGPFGASILTADENQAGERLRAWHLGFVDLWDPAGFALVGYLGHFNELGRAEALPAHHAAFTLQRGEHLVLCSDGVSDYVGDTHPEVASAFVRSIADADPDDAARTLVNLANAGGGGDNASCIVARIWQ